VTRVAYVCADPGVPVLGCKGCSVHVQEMLRALLRRGVAIDLFAMRCEGSWPEDLRAVRVHALPAPARGDLDEREHALIAANQDLRAALIAAGPFDWVYERQALFADAAMDHARTFGIPGLLEINAPLVEEQRRHRGLRNEDLAESAATRAFASASWLLPVSEALAQWLRGRVPSGARIDVVPNGVDAARFAAARRIALEPETFTVGFVGGLRPWHGLSDLAAIFSRVRRDAPRARLVVVGDGPGRGDLERDLVARGARDSVLFTGAVAPALVPAWLAAMDVVVAPYPGTTGGDDRFYFSPLKIFEYLAAGRAIVASRVGQISQILSHGETGWLHAPGDIEDAARGILTLMRDEALRRKLGSAGQRWVARHRSWDSIAETLITRATSIPRMSGAPAAAGVG
jgi:glycosyltransferase involved in cell wall biosynthesis